MTSSVETRRQHIYDELDHFISAERLDSASFSSSPARLQSNQPSETPVLSDVQSQNTSEVDNEVKSTEGKSEEVEGQQQKEGQEALAEIRKELEDTTGFGSYEAYLQSFDRDPMYLGRSYTDILDGCFHEPHDMGSGVDIIDVSNGDLSPIGVSLRCQDLSATEISRALCHPPSSTRVQIVLWPIDRYSSDIENFLDVLGVGLQLEPCFFEALRWREDHHTRSTQRGRSKNILCIRSIGTSVFVARNFALAQDNPVPIVLIAGPMHEPVWKFNHRTLLDISNPNDAFYDLVQPAPLYGHYKCDDDPRFANVYIRALFNILKSGRDPTLSPGDTILACIIPLLKIEIAICKGDLDQLSHMFHQFKDSFCDSYGFKTRYRGRYARSRDDSLPNGEAPEYLYRWRTKLRSWVEYFENQNGALMGLNSSLLGPNVTGGVFYPQIKEESISIAQEASRVEAEVRDHLQLQGSKLALMESKKSIEVSENQIHESKRVKIFTVLAFFYIPLNLATSVFGMNLQQLNRSGASIGVFLSTAGILLFVTGVSWLVLEGVQDVRAWFRRPEQDKYRIASENPGISLRLYMFWWLSRNGLFVWMVRTGAGWCLLINSSTGFQPSESLFDASGHTACDFVVTMMLYKQYSRSILNADKGGWLFRRKANSILFPAGFSNS